MDVYSFVYPMSDRRLRQRFFRFNLILALVAGALSCVFMLIAGLKPEDAMMHALRSMITFVSIGQYTAYVISRRNNHPPRHPRLDLIVRYALAFTGSMIINMAVWSLYVWSTDMSVWMPPHLLPILPIVSCIISVLAILLYRYVKLEEDKVQSEMENLRLQAIVSNTAHQLLKQQIHPHFLFNVLNTVKSLYKKDARQGETFLVHLANFLRASLSNPASRIVSLDEELRMCDDYIAMQQIRFGDALRYHIDINDADRQRYDVPYFSLQILLENAIKHNDLGRDKPLTIAVHIAGDMLVTRNNRNPRRTPEPSTGTGLYNLTERYRLLTRHEPIIEDHTEAFTVSLKLIPHEDHHH